MSNASLIFGLILSGLNIVNMVYMFVLRAKEPTKTLECKIREQEEEIKTLKYQYSQLASTQTNATASIETLEDGNKVMQRALLALLGHAIDGNNTEEMRIVRADLNKIVFGVQR